MHVNDHKIQGMGVRKCIYLFHFMWVIIITRRVPFQVFSSKNQHAKCEIKLYNSLINNDLITTTKCCRI